MINLFNRLEELRGKNPCGIYLLQINNKQYVGSSINIKKRLRKHRTMLRTQTHDNKYLQHLYNKYVKCEYKILEICEFDTEFMILRLKEKEWIDKLQAELNLDDPIKGIGGFHEKKVYQYSLEGIFIKEWGSATIAARSLHLTYAPIHSCANLKIIASKSAHGFQWSYIKHNQMNNYICNTGSNLETRYVHLYNLDETYYKSFDSLSDCARYIAIIIDYKGDWKSIRTGVFYALQKPTTRKVRKRYFVSYIKSSTFLKSLSMGS